MGLPKSGDDNDWEKIVVDLLSLIEVNNDLLKFKLFNVIKCIVFYQNFIQKEDTGNNNN